MEHLKNYVIFSLCVWECLEALYFKKEVLENANTKNEELLIPVFKFEDKSYYVGELKLTYLEADQFCRNIDMRLVTIQSSEEFETLWGYIQNNSNERKFWSSGARLLDGHNWIWISTLENVEFTKWKPGKPNNNTDEQCLEFLSDENANFLFNEKNCHEKNAFICEKDNRRQIKQEGDNSSKEHTYASENSCGPPNINLMHFEGKTYYMGNNFETTFLEGIQFCQMIHMQLVSVDTEAENNRLHKYIRDTVAGHSFWSSGTKAIDGKTWMWLSTGTPIEFTQWEKNQPNHAEQQCIELVEHKNEGLFWNDDDCNDKHFFICESYDEYPLFEIGSTYSTTRTARSADGYTYQYGQYQESKQDKIQNEAKHKAKEEADKKAKEEAYKKAKGEAEKEAKEEAEKKAKEEAEKKAKEEAEKKAKEEAERKAKDEAEKKVKEEAEKKTKEEAERKVAEEAEKKEKEKEEKKEKEKKENKEKAEKKETAKSEKKDKEKGEKKEKEKAEKIEKEEKKKKEHKKDALKYEITLDEGHYRFSNIKVNHEEADQTCKQYGMELVSIPNEKKDAFVNDLIKEYGKSDGKYWTSGTKKSDDQWVWGDLQPITYFNWAPSEPDSDQYCLQVRATGLWHDQDCDRNSLFICENVSYSAPSYSDTYTYQANVEPYHSSSY